VRSSLKTTNQSMDSTTATLHASLYGVVSNGQCMRIICRSLARHWFEWSEFATRSLVALLHVMTLVCPSELWIETQQWLPKLDRSWIRPAFGDPRSPICHLPTLCLEGSVAVLTGTQDVEVLHALQGALRGVFGKLGLWFQLAIVNRVRHQRDTLRVSRRWKLGTSMAVSTRIRQQLVTTTASEVR